MKKEMKSKIKMKRENKVKSTVNDLDTMKVAELKKVEQESRIIEEFVQEFRRAARESKYKERPLIEGFKREINSTIRIKLMEAECYSRSIEQWYEQAVNLDRH